MLIVYGIVYKITNTVNSKVYIGQTIQTVTKRFKEHLRGKTCLKLKRAMDKYGKNSFCVEELESASSKIDLDALEQRYIDFFDSIKTGYNIRNAGSRGKWNQDSVKKLKDTVKLRKSRSGQFRSVQKYDLSGQLIEVYESITAAANACGIDVHAICSCLSGNSASSGGFLWSYEDSEPKLKTPHKGAAILQLDCNNTTINEFPSISCAARKFKINRPSISKCCLGERPTAGGFKWKYK